MAPNKVDINQERLRYESGLAPLHEPAFMADAAEAAATAATSMTHFWRDPVQKHISSLTFVLTCLPDCEYFSRLLSCDKLPKLYKAITAVSLPNFYQFAGIRDNRTSNPYINVIKGLPNLTHLTLTFHTAGLTASKFKERERMTMENRGEVEASKELRVQRLDEVVGFYKLDDVFEITSLKALELRCIDSELVGHFVKVGDRLKPFREMREYFLEGFDRRMKCGKIEVEMALVDVPYT